MNKNKKVTNLRVGAFSNWPIVDSLQLGLPTDNVNYDLVFAKDITEKGKNRSEQEKPNTKMKLKK